MKTTMTDATWIELFTLELRLRRVPGNVIGDAVASVREFLADSGQSAEEAFGPARAYAAALDLPARPPRSHAVRTVLLPVLGLFAFLVFALASTAWFAGGEILLSVPQALLMCVPLLLTVMFAFPFYPRAVLRQRWVPAALVVVAGLVGAVSSLIAPSSAADAWLELAPLPVLIGTAMLMVTLSIVATVLTLRGGTDEIVDPLPTAEARTARGPGRRFLILVDWLFPILAVVVFALTALLTMARG
ncbi:MULTISPECIES: hypothetical protein [unclassified Microbacterium]|uniref:hypothetical protein n=1 Tax=unclassified Microbacterium TaxID=2609290 RepID=UPI00301A8D04